MSFPKHVVMFSGGVCSWAAAKRLVEREGIDGVVLLFADTMMEDEDLYRFLDEAAANIGAPLVRIADGRTPWQVMNDVAFIGNSMMDPCSKILKRELLDKWRNENCSKETTTIHLGMSWDEGDRFERVQKRALPWRYAAPMTEKPWVSKEMMFEWLQREGIRAPRLYGMGFPHNNCGGFCIKAGQAHFANLLAKMPERYAFHEAQEEALRLKVGNHSIMRSRKGGTSTPLTLKAFRESIQAKQKFDENDYGGCGCAIE